MLQRIIVKEFFVCCIRSFYYIYKGALHIAVEKENIEIIKLLLSNEKLDINIPYIFKLFIKFKMK